MGWASGGDQYPVIASLSVGAVAARQSLPGGLGEPFGDHVGADLECAGGDLVVARHRQHVAELLHFQETTQRAVVTVGLIGCHPAERHPGGTTALDHSNVLLPNLLIIDSPRKAIGTVDRTASSATASTPAWPPSPERARTKSS